LYVINRLADSLYQELLLVKQQLDAVNPSNAVDIKRRLTEVNQLLTNALDSSSRLDTKLKSVIDTSKQALIAVKDENTTLKTSLEGLEEQLKDRQTKLDEYRDRHHQLSLLFDEDNTDLQDKVKHVLFLNEKHAEEKKVLKNQFDALQMKSENDAMTMKQMKLKLESCTTQIRDLQAENTRLLAENADCGMASELAILKKTLESTKVENLELQSTVEATQNQLLMLRKSENVSSLLELENKQLRQKLIDMEAASREETDKLLELVESLKTKVNDTATAAEEVEQDELMRMHTRAQLGLIEYLEGEENVPLAMAKFKKQLETEMREFGLTSHS
jgi:septal ring factor EnvC (AmiA/AmiB activator)